jgi:hypothetical protein
MIVADHENGKPENGARRGDHRIFGTNSRLITFAILSRQSGSFATIQ